jgi:hypothetical protein
VDELVVAAVALVCGAWMRIILKGLRKSIPAEEDCMNMNCGRMKGLADEQKELERKAGTCMIS